MKKILSMMVCLVLVASFAVSPLKTNASTIPSDKSAQIQLLLQLISLLQAQLDAITGGKTLAIDTVSAQSELDIVTEGTELEGRTLKADEKFIFTDGKEGVDTVIYKNPKSSYSLYRGKDTSSKGYGNVIIVVGKVTKFIEVDVNSEFIQFSDQTLSIPDFKVVKVVEKKENLTISSIELSLQDGIGHTSEIGVPVPEQTVSVEIKNNEFGSFNGSGEKLNYSAYLYEITDSGSRIKTSEMSSGEVLVPYANGYSSFDFTIAGGLPFDGVDYERDFQIRVDIDTDDSVDESNESDNKGWSDTWMVDYYKG